MKHNIPLVVTTLPNKAHLVSLNHASRWTFAPIEQLQAFCQNRGIPFYSPVHELETALRAGAPVYFSDKCIWTIPARRNGPKAWPAISHVDPYWRASSAATMAAPITA